MQVIKNQMRRFWRDSRRLSKEEDGQIIVFTALSSLALVLMVVTIFNVGMVIGEKMKAQNAADAAAYSQAVWEARALNFLAYTNRAILSHMVTIAFCTAVLSQEKLWRKLDAASNFLSAIPYIGPFLRVMAQIIYRLYRIAAAVARPVREAARAWIDACRAYQTAIMFELGVKTATGYVAQNVVQSIDPKLQMFYSTVAGGLNAANLARITGTHPSPVDYWSLKKTYVASMDGYSRGTSLPRRLSVTLFPFFKAAQFGFTGRVGVYRDRIKQDEGFFLNWMWDSLKRRWRQRYFAGIAPVTYAGVRLGRFAMWNYHRSARAAKKELFPSVYAAVQKKRGDILQLKLLNAQSQQDITAFARAEVFYWDADARRSAKLRTAAPAREPNLFNPFWHARLAAVDGALPILPPGSRRYLPITH